MKSHGNRKRFILLRHEITRENKIGLIQGQSVGGTLVSHELNPEKVKWCKKNVLPPAVIVSSSSARCAESAALLENLLDIPLSVSALFIQRGWGIAEGKSVGEMKKRSAKIAFLAGAGELRRGAESLRAVTGRAKEAWEHLKNTDARTVIVVTHDEFSNYLVNEMLAEGLFKRSLAFNQAHVVDCINGTIKKVVLHANVYLEPITRRVLLRSDAAPFLDDPVGARVLRSHGIALIREEKLDKMKNLSLIEGIIVGDDPVAVDDLLARYPNLKIVSKGGKGVDNIRVADKELVRRGVICVANTPGCNERTVAEFAAALAMNAVRRISDLNLEMKNKVWRRKVTPNYSEVTVGIIGLGAIGRELATILKGLGFSLVAWTIHPERHADFIRDGGIRMLGSVDEVYSLAHIVSLHLRLSGQTENMLGLKQLKAMGANHGYLINCSRAGLLDYRELKTALEKNWVSGAALDVWPEEPIRSGWLRELAADPRVVATPHAAGSTQSAISKSIALRAYNIAWHLYGLPGVTAVPPEELE